ncbi:Aldose sugar dehydrogenase YliI [Burkholderiaceae bacterium]|nr:Aldose sugar dehydrogenase YliI [Burkholderiaceae bacterium]
MRSRRRVIYAIAAVLLIGALAAWATPKVLRRLDMQGLKPVTVAKGLDSPWSIAFLPGGSMLVTERPGRMRIVTPDGRLGKPLAGLPPVWAKGEGGLLDVATDPQFASNRTIYWSYAEPAVGDAEGASTAVARGRLADNRVEDVRVIFRQTQKSADVTHFGSRLLFDSNGLLYVTLGDRGQRADAQKLDSAHGKILRMRTDGSAPPDNPFVSTPGALPQIWSIGHRNVQGIAFHPVTGELWASEHGPQGGDELNVIVAGRNYGWPVITHGTEYSTSAKIGEGTEKPGMEQPVTWWGPISIAPSGMAFLTSDRYPQWKGQLFIGNLRGQALRRIKLDGHQVVEQQRLVTGLLERVRDVRQGPDGWLYITSHHPEGRIIRVER